MLGEAISPTTFLAIFARTATVFSFVPIPGLKSPVSVARIILSLAVTLALASVSPPIAKSTLGSGDFVVLLVSEFCLGLTAGLLLSFFFEVFQFAAQMLSQQAGFSYAATIDPTNNTDTGVLLVLSQLLAGLTGLALGLDRQIISILSESFQVLPPGHFAFTPSLLSSVQKAGATVFQVGPSLAIPSVALFLCIDIILGILSRIEQQLQLTTILFPLKTAGSVAVVIVIFSVYPGVMSRLLETTLAALRQAFGL